MQDIQKLLEEAKNLNKKKNTFRLEGVEMIKGDKGDKGDNCNPEDVARILSKDKAFRESVKGEDSKPSDVVSLLLSNQSFLNTVKGEDGKSIKLQDVVSNLKNDKDFVKSLKGESGQDFTPDLETLAINTINTLETFEGDDRLDAKAIKNLEKNIDTKQLDFKGVKIDAKNVTGILDLLPKNPPMYAGGSGATFLKSLRDVDITGLTKNAEGKFVLGGSQSLQDVTNVGATTTIESTFSSGLVSTFIKAYSSAGFHIHNQSGQDVALFGAGGGDGTTLYGGTNINGALDVQSGGLYVENSTKLVGINTSTPTTRLDINADAISGGNTLTFSGLPDATSNTVIRALRTGGGVGVRLAFDGNVQEDFDILNSSGTRRFRFDSLTGGMELTPPNQASGGFNLQQMTVGSWTNSSLVNKVLNGTVTINQSGTAGFNIIDFSITQTAIGSGEKNLIRFIRAGSTMMQVDYLGQQSLAVGSVSTPAYSFVGDLNTGMYQDGADILSFATGGVRRLRIEGSNGRVLAQQGGTSNMAGVMTTAWSSNTVIGNVGAGEDDLRSFTLSGSTLNSNADVIYLDAVGLFASNANNKRVRMYFGGTLIFDTTALAFNGGNWRIQAKVARTSTTTADIIVTWTSSNTTLASQQTYTAFTGNMLASNIMKVTAEATADNDITQRNFQIYWQPA